MYLVTCLHVTCLSAFWRGDNRPNLRSLPSDFKDHAENSLKLCPDKASNATRNSIPKILIYPHPSVSYLPHPLYICDHIFVSEIWLWFLAPIANPRDVGCIRRIGHWPIALHHLYRWCCTTVCSSWFLSPCRCGYVTLWLVCTNPNWRRTAGHLRRRWRLWEPSLLQDSLESSIALFGFWLDSLQSSPLSVFLLQFSSWP